MYCPCASLDFDNYRRQIKSICRQLQFLEKYESNMIITSEVTAGGLGDLTRLLNGSLQRQKKRENAESEKGTDDRRDLHESVVMISARLSLLWMGIFSFWKKRSRRVTGSDI